MMKRSFDLVEKMEKIMEEEKMEKEKKEKKENPFVGATGRVLTELVVRKICSFVYRPSLFVVAQVSSTWKACALAEFFSTSSSSSSLAQHNIDECLADVVRDDLRTLWFYAFNNNNNNDDNDDTEEEQVHKTTHFMNLGYVYCALAWIDAECDFKNEQHCAVAQKFVWGFEDDSATIRYLDGLRDRDLMHCVALNVELERRLLDRPRIGRWYWRTWFHPMFVSLLNDVNLGLFDDDKEDDDDDDEEKMSHVRAFMELGYRTRDTAMLDVVEPFYQISNVDECMLVQELRPLFWAAVHSGDVAMLERFKLRTPRDSVRYSIDLLMNDEYSDESDEHAVHEEEVQTSFAVVASLGSLPVLVWVAERCSFSEAITEDEDEAMVFAQACLSHTVDVPRWLYENYPGLFYTKSVERAFKNARQYSTLEVVDWLLQTFHAVLVPRPPSMRKFVWRIAPAVLRRLIGVYALAESETSAMLLHSLEFTLGLMRRWGDEHHVEACAFVELARDVRLDWSTVQRALVRSTFDAMKRRRTNVVEWIFTILGTPTLELQPLFEKMVLQNISTLFRYPGNRSECHGLEIFKEFMRRLSRCIISAQNNV
jgi:hypothetical protein